MMKNLLASLFIFFPSLAFSSEKKGFWFFVGSDGGYLYSNVDESIGERNKDGYQVNLYGLGSYYYGPLVTDVGFGWLYHSFEGKSAIAGFGDETVTARALFADLGVRWIPFSQFQIGPKFHTQFATDLSYLARVRTDNDLVFFGGLQAAYDWALNENLSVRFIAQFLTDLSVRNVQVYVGQGGLQIGFSPTRLWTGKDEASSAAPARLPPPPPPPSVEAPPAVSTTPEITATEPPPQLVVTLESESFRFESNSAKLNATSRRRLVAIGSFLGKNADAWGRLRVEGHTDQIGSQAYNQQLSEQRAETVRESLLAGGAPPEKVVARGFSFTRPLDPATTKEALAKNRRVELEFDEVLDPAKFQRELESIKKID